MTTPSLAAFYAQPGEEPEPEETLAAFYAQPADDEDDEDVPLHVLADRDQAEHMAQLEDETPAMEHNPLREIALEDVLAHVAERLGTGAVLGLIVAPRAGDARPQVVWTVDA